MPEGHGEADSLGDGERLAFQLQLAGIKTLRHQGSASREEQVSISVGGIRNIAYQAGSVFGV
jgi:hypothetical protein